MGEIQISLTLPIELGAEALTAPAVQEALSATPGVRVLTSADAREAGAAFEDFGATAVAILGSAAAVAAAKALFGVIRTTIEQAYLMRRERQAQEHELRKLVLVLGRRRHEIDLDQSLAQIEGRVTELELEAAELVS